MWEESTFVLEYTIMNEPIEIHSDDDSLKKVQFKIYGYKDKRVAKQFMPKPDEPQTKELEVPWGDTLTMKRGDYLVSSADDTKNQWPVEKEIFEQSYTEEEPGSGIFKKVASVGLVPLTEFTNGNPEQLVTVHSLEGPETVPAGRFHLARGIKGEIWPFPNNEIEKVLYEM
jgi:hypothetical protein